MPSFADKLSAGEIKAGRGLRRDRGRDGRPARSRSSPTTRRSTTAAATQACYEQAFGNLAYDEGPKAALDKLAQLSEHDPLVRGGCHPIAHTIGAGGLLHYEGDVGKAFAEGNADVRLRATTTACSSGSSRASAADQVAGVARSACNDPDDQGDAFNYYQCDHGLGHGLMLYTVVDLPAGARLLPPAADRVRPGLVQRRRLHGEPELLVRPAHEVAEHEEPALPV